MVIKLTKAISDKKHQQKNRVQDEKEIFHDIFQDLDHPNTNSQNMETVATISINPHIFFSSKIFHLVAEYF